MPDIDLILRDYYEAVRLSLWYQGSRFSVHKGKANKELANRYRDISHGYLAEYYRQKRGD